VEMRKTQLLPTRLAHQKIERHGFGEGNIRMPKLNCIFMRVLREELPATEILILRYYSKRKGKEVLSHCWHKLCNISRISRFYYTHTFSFLFRFFDGSWQFFRESRQLPKTSTQISVVCPCDCQYLFLFMCVLRLLGLSAKAYFWLQILIDT